MTVYIDLVCIINFIYDFLILLTVSFTLKRNRKIYYYILSSIIGVLSIFLLFLKIKNRKYLFFSISKKKYVIITKKKEGYHE